ncbi:MAG TPA: anti-sigma factor [Xanthobacteraceae bacterium]|nr:anti-sigma factor [Xanthobacteraceae bacterium]
MIDRTTPVTDEELHVYVDGELPPDRRPAVEAWLASHPEDAARVAGWRALAESIRTRYGPVADEPVPDRLTLDRITRKYRSWGNIVAAAALAAFLIGGIAGWMARGASAAAPSEVALFTAEAFDAHKLYIGEVRHPIEVKANEDHLLPWLSRRVGTTLRAPDLGAFDLKLLGGRLLPSVNGPAALFMYEGANGERFTIYCSRLNEARTSFRYDASGNFGSVRWVESNYGWVVSGPKDKDRLKAVAAAAYDQVESRTPAPSRGSADQLISRRGS